VFYVQFDHRRSRLGQNICVWGGGAVAASLAAKLSGLGDKTFLHENGKVLGLGDCGNPFNDFTRRGGGNILL